MSVEAVITHAVRTPVGSLGGSLVKVTAPKLGAIVVKSLLERSGIPPEDFDEIIMANVVGAGLGQAPARQAALFGGLKNEIAALTINKVCGGGLKAVALAAQAVKLGDSGVVIAGGLESMSNAPYALFKARFGYRLGHGELVDLMIHDGLWCAFNDYHMGYVGEITADKYGISRERQDQYAVKSHQKAVAAIKAGRFKSQIVPVIIPKRKGEPVVVDADERSATRTHGGPCSLSPHACDHINCGLWIVRLRATRFGAISRRGAGAGWRPGSSCAT